MGVTGGGAEHDGGGNGEADVLLSRIDEVSLLVAAALPPKVAQPSAVGTESDAKDSLGRAAHLAV